MRSSPDVQQPLKATASWFRPRPIPLMARPSYRRELLAWSLLPVMMGALEGGVVATIATRAFVGVASQASIDLAVAIIIGAGASANLSSALWASLSSGRNKVRALVLLQIATALCAAVPAILPLSSGGLLMLTLSVVLARVFWCGVVTVRTTVWAANWTRDVRARVTGRIMVMSAIAAAVTGLLFGGVLDSDPEAFRWLFPSAALVGLAGAAVYGRIRVRRHAALQRSERAVTPNAGLLPRNIARPLIQNRHFRRFMACLFVLGSGNMMVDAPLVLALNTRFSTDYLLSIAVVSSIPIITMPLVVGLWSRLLDRVHVVRFRAVHSWAFVASNLMLLIGIALASMPIVIVAAVVRGVGYAGGVLAWNLGHHDFAPPGESGRYMGTHVTLTGIRGLCAPLLGVFLWQWLGWPAFALPLMLSLAGALGFLALARRWGDVTPNTVQQG